jgi:hypothetical protein
VTLAKKYEENAGNASAIIPLVSRSKAIVLGVDHQGREGEGGRGRGRGREGEMDKKPFPASRSPTVQTCTYTTQLGKRTH